MTRLQFRILILAVFAIANVDSIIQLMFPSPIPEHIQSLVDAHYAELMTSLSSLNFIGFIALISFVGQIIGLLGLFLFRRWSIKFNLVLVVVLPLLKSFVGFGLLSWIEMATQYWSHIGLGLALGAAYFSPLKGEFK